MGKNSALTTGGPLISFQGQRALESIGENLKIARLRRGDTEDEAALRVGVSRHTWRRLEQGLPSVSLGLFIEAMVIYGFTSQLFELANPDDDLTGKSMEAARRPKRGRRS